MDSIEEEECEDFPLDEVKQELEDALGGSEDEEEWDATTPLGEDDIKEEEDIKEEGEEISDNYEEEEDNPSTMISQSQMHQVVIVQSKDPAGNNMEEEDSNTTNYEEEEEVEIKMEDEDMSGSEDGTMGKIILPSNYKKQNPPPAIINAIVKVNNNPSKPNNSTITVNTASGNLTLTLGKFLYRRGLCRVCLLEKEDSKNIFDILSVNGPGALENFRRQDGPKDFRYNIHFALKMLVGIHVTPGDGLPDQICVSCLDTLLSFSVFRKKISLSQEKLQVVIDQVQGTSNPVFIPPFGEADFGKTDIYKYPSKIIAAQQMINSSTSCHLVRRNLSDRNWDYIFQALSSAKGRKSDKVKAELSAYVCEKPYVIGLLCVTCNQFIYGSLKDYAKHQEDLHLNTAVVLYPCEVCGCSYPLEKSSETYLFHWLDHFYIYPCDICDQHFPSTRALGTHKNTYHHVSSLVCNLCHVPFLTKVDLVEHIKTHNEKGQKELEICQICGKAMTTTSLSLHMKRFHPSQHREWECKVCKQIFDRKDGLEAHALTAHVKVPKKFDCETCGESFKSSITRDTHVLKQHKNEKPYPCTTCGKRFYSKCSLKSHTVQHEDRTVHCPEPGCGKSFKRKEYLEEHLRVHSGDRPYSCEICGRTVRMKSNFYKHMKIHKRETREASKQQISTTTSTV